MHKHCIRMLGTLGGIFCVQISDLSTFNFDSKQPKLLVGLRCNSAHDFVVTLWMPQRHHLKKHVLSWSESFDFAMCNRDEANVKILSFFQNFKRKPIPLKFNSKKVPFGIRDVSNHLVQVSCFLAFITLYYIVLHRFPAKMRPLVKLLEDKNTINARRNEGSLQPNCRAACQNCEKTQHIRLSKLFTHELLFYSFTFHYCC